ncbi:hypothetical protein [Glycomyces tenuis]|uniref:hypothetical protein n=1 Tax=Glycomyces tenuis TaxID=58116 RepID=UPI00041694E9|nr:hypothetical protein [Glycomyces tenuis]
MLITGDAEAWTRAYWDLDAALTGRRILLAARDWIWGHEGERWWAGTARELGLDPLRHRVAVGDDLNARSHA